MKLNQFKPIFENQEEDGDNQFFTEEHKIRGWLSFMGIKNFTINEDLTVDVNGDLNFQDKSTLKTLPVKFRHVMGTVIFSKCGITTLKGCPDEVYGEFHLYWCNQLESLEFISKIAGVYRQHAMMSIDSCSRLESLKGISEDFNGTLEVIDCENLKSLNGVPKKLNTFIVGRMPIYTFENFPENVEQLEIHNSDRLEKPMFNSFSNFNKHVKHCEILSINDFLPNKAILPIMLLDGLVKVKRRTTPFDDGIKMTRAFRAFELLQKNVEEGADVLDFHNELLDADLEEFTEL